MEYIDSQVREYVQEFDIHYNSCSVGEAERKMMKLKVATEILSSIEDKILSEAILKYIAPYFCLSKSDDKNDDMIEI